MKLIHCADIHLGSSLTSHYTKEQAKQRSDELLNTFIKMIEYADKNEIRGIIIAGDLFDKDSGIKNIKKEVYKVIGKYEKINFYYLKGNHDCLAVDEELPNNMFCFSNEWKSYQLDGIYICGIENNDNSSRYIYATLALNYADFNIVVMHGQESERDNKNDAAIINLKALRNKHIDYLALGHLHYYKEEVLDERGKYCYPGCLEGRGFDEVGSHGFVLLDIDVENKKYHSEFIEFAESKIYQEEVDITGKETSTEVAIILKGIIFNKHFTKNDLVEFVLKGEISLDSNIDESLIINQIKEYLKIVKIKNRTSIKIDFDNFAFDKSLKGEIVRILKDDNSLDDNEKNRVVKCCFEALGGNEI